MMDDKSYEMFENLFSKETLISNLSFAAFYIAFYEAMKTSVVDNVKGFYCIENVRFEDGKLKADATEEYKRYILGIKPDGKHPHEFLSCLLWLKDGNAITGEDYDFIANTVRITRDAYAHRLFDFLVKKPSNTDYENLKRLLLIHKKINKWWATEIEGLPEDSENIFDMAANSLFTILYEDNQRFAL